MSIIANMMNNLSEEDKNKLGRSGVKINTDGAHKVKIIEAYEIGGDTMPRFYIKFEDAEGKTVDKTLFLQSTVGKDENGNVKAGEYFVNGIKTHLSDANDKYDNTRALGQISNLWKIVGNDPKQFGAGIVTDTVTFASKGEQPIEKWTQLIGKELTIVTSYLVTLDKDGKKAWRNQDVNMDTLFNVDGLSKTELDAGKTEPISLTVAVSAAKANAKIEFKNRNNRICMTELKLIGSVGVAPTAQTVTAPDTDDEDIF